MFKQFKIGIVGQGFVGTATRKGLENYYEDIYTYDKYNSINSNSIDLEDLCQKSEIIFICLPTPMTKEGECFTGIVEDTIKKIDSFANSNSKKIAIIKSTIPPGTTQTINKATKNIKVIFNPEFLTEANSIDDFKNQDRIILGGEEKEALEVVSTMYSQVFKKIPIIKTNSTTAEMVKYTTNTFLSTKVSFANEIKIICDNIDIDYSNLINIVTLDKRLGDSHWKVPGPDGKMGFGGSCFPKDLQALIYFANKIQCNPLLLNAVWEKNLLVRPEKDWEKLKGRAVFDGTDV